MQIFIRLIMEISNKISRHSSKCGIIKRTFNKEIGKKSHKIITKQWQFGWACMHFKHVPLEKMIKTTFNLPNACWWGEGITRTAKRRHNRKNKHV